MRSSIDMEYFFIGIYVILSVSGLTLFKLGSKEGFLFNASSGFFSLNMVH